MRRIWWFVLILLPVVALVLPPFGQRLVTLVGVYALMGIGYQLVFGHLGALNLAQGALFGVGAYATALAVPLFGPGAFVIGMIVAAAVAAVAALPLLRLQSHYFALATLALASLVNLVAVHDEDLTGGANGLVGFAGSLPSGAVLLAAVWLCVAAAVFGQTRLIARHGETLRLIRQVPLVAATLGIDTRRWRFIAFVAGAALAGLAGGGAAAVSGVVSPETTGFPIMLLCLTSVVLGGARHPMGAVLGALLAVCLPELFRGLSGGWLLAYAVATLAVVLWAPQGLAGLIDPPAAPPVPQIPEQPSPGSAAQRLVLTGVGKKFGGVEALADVSLSLVRGEIVGLIGPNGSGKTTLLNVISGLERVDSGTIDLDGRRLERLRPSAIARAGVSRTFQSGEERFAGIARALSTGAAFLLLDEPMAGATAAERARLLALLGQLRAAGYGVLVVDHDVALLSRLCDRIVSLDRGRVVA
jgi:branched-chain amino acid transport system permease protein